MSSLRPGTVDYSKWDNLSVSSHGTDEEREDDDRKINKVGDVDSDGEEYDDDDEDEEESEDEFDSVTLVRQNFQRPVANTPNTRAAARTTITPQVRAPAPSLAALQTAWNTKSTGEAHDENVTIGVQGHEEKKQKIEPKLGLSSLCAACGSTNPKYRCSRCEVRSEGFGEFRCALDNDPEKILLFFNAARKIL